jgi:hypothetical protein
MPGAAAIELGVDAAFQKFDPSMVRMAIATLTTAGRRWQRSAFQDAVLAATHTHLCRGSVGLTLPMRPH